LEFHGHASLRLGRRATFTTFIDVGSRFRPTPRGLLSLSARNTIAIFFASSPIGLF
jgi:hypothetical protein